jgi:exopolysaccharide biosynthesis polyprenyl glycosylphosphotransferase
VLRTALAIADEQGARAAERRDALYRRALAGADVFAAAFAAILCVSVIGDDALKLEALVALPVIVLMGKIIGLYDRDEVVIRKTTLEEAPKLFQLATLYALVLWLLRDRLIDGELGDGQVLGLWACLFVSALVSRTLTRRAVAALAPPERCVFMGDREGYDRMADKLADDPSVHAMLLGRVPLDPTVEEDSNGSHLGDIDDLPRLIAEHDIHRVFVAPQSDDNEPMLEIVRTMKSLGVKVSLVPRVFEVVGSSVEFDDIGGMTVLGIRRFGLARSSQRVKRTTDLIGAGVLLTLASPLLALIAAAIKVDSPGPVFFRQIRVGRDGARFQMLKFRTMVKDAEAMKPALRDRNEADGLFKIADDPRVTRVGRLLRRTSLDEMPQLFNVLRGEMSLVGPRPLILDEDLRVEGWHRRRLNLTPGMTGHWQILGSARIPLREMVKIDYLYVANWSLWTDLKILLRTVPYVLTRRGL